MTEKVTNSAAGRPPSAERDRRYQRLREALERESMDGLLAYAAGWRREQVRYLTGAPLRGSFALAYLPLEGDPVALAGGADREATAAAGWVTDVRPLEALEDLIRSRSPRRLAVAHLELMPLHFRGIVSDALGGAPAFSATRLAERVQMVKSPWELERVRRAGAICDAGWQAFIGAMEEGLPDYRVVAAVERELKRMGAEDNFMLIASGKDEVMGMTPPGGRRLERGDLVRTELTPQIEGYWAQICRSAVVGAPDEGQRKSYELFEEALLAGLEVVKAGVTAHDVAMAENDVFRRHGYGEFCTAQYTRVRGHGHGLHPDEAPPIVEGEHTVLPAGAVVIVHPNTYTPLAGYHVLGDPVVVTETGYEPLLRTERRLFNSEEVA